MNSHDHDHNPPLRPSGRTEHARLLEFIGDWRDQQMSIEAMAAKWLMSRHAVYATLSGLRRLGFRIPTRHARVRDPVDPGRFVDVWDDLETYPSRADVCAALGIDWDEVTNMRERMRKRGVQLRDRRRYSKHPSRNGGTSHA
jgi:biotin operon repressor